ncbi:MAG: tRNA 2-thiocytidine(32) synthetase TtcA [Porticoccus sp.]|nr:tRNA 2-thiocytidine(32) synthetase TtcA [Porticoccus sp.]
MTESSTVTASLIETPSNVRSADVHKKERLELNKLHKRLRRNVGNAIADYNMIEDGDKIMVCLSGGKDSYCMLDVLLHLQKTAPISFEIVAVNLDQKQPGFPPEVLPKYLSEIGVPFHILEKDTYSVVTEVIPEGKTYCSLCSRLRRGTLYGFAQQIGATKIALGHHRDDIIETLFLNMFYGGKLKAMPPKLLSDDKKNMVIRPLAYCKEGDLETYAELKQFPIIPCNLCGSQDGLQRQVIKDMLQQWEKQHPGRLETIFAATKNIAPSQLADTDLFDFSNLKVERENEQEQRIGMVNLWEGDNSSHGETSHTENLGVSADRVS